MRRRRELGLDGESGVGVKGAGIGEGAGVRARSYGPDFRFALFSTFSSCRL